MDNEAIGLKIVKLRTELNLTTTELARMVGISQAQISRLENGKQGFRSATLSKIADALGVKPVYFFMDETNADLSDFSGNMIAGSKNLKQALNSPLFIEAAEVLADLYLNHQEIFVRVRGDTLRWKKSAESE